MSSNNITDIFQQAHENAAQAELLFLQLKAKIAEIDIIKSKMTDLWNPSIDYGFIDDAFLRKNLEDDCRRMAVARTGFKGNPRKDDFADFCSFAHLQIEGCLSYYYNKVSNGDLASYNIYGSNILSAKGVKFAPQKSMGFATMFYLANYEFDLYNKSKNDYFMMRDLANYRNSLLFHRSVEANNSLKPTEKTSLEILVSNMNFNRVVVAVQFVAKLVQDAAKKFEDAAIQEIDEDLPKEQENHGDSGTYAEEVVEKPALNPASSNPLAELSKASSPIALNIDSPPSSDKTQIIP